MSGIWTAFWSTLSTALIPILGGVGLAVLWWMLACRPRPTWGDR